MRLALIPALLLATALSGCGARTLCYDPGRPDALLDLHTPSGDGPWPTVVYVHGGAWRSGDRSDGDEVAERLVPDGYAVASIDYRLAPRHRWPAQHEDVLAAIAYLRAHGAALGLDPDKIGAFGVSAGGHLVAMAALAPGSGLRCAVVAAAEGDLRVQGREPIMQDEVSILTDLLGPPPWPEATLAALSPAVHARPGVPILVLHSERDTNVFSTQGQRLHAALAEAGATTKLVVTPDGAHGRAWKQPAQLEAILAWLAEHLR